MANLNNIFITGGTGQQGGAVARSLINDGLHVKILTRHPDSAKALELKQKGAKIIKGSFHDFDTIAENLKGSDGLFLMSTPFESGIQGEIDQAKRLVDLAANISIPFLLFTSVVDADKQTGIPHFDSKFEIEKHIKSKNLNHSIIAPAYFYENFFSPFVLPGLKNGFFAQALSASKKLQSISVETIGNFAAYIFEHPDTFNGKRINIASDELNGTEYSQLLTRKSGKTIQYQEIPLAEIRKNSEDMAKMYEWFENVGYSVNINDLKLQYPQVNWITFNDWLEKQDFSILN